MWEFILPPLRSWSFTHFARFLFKIAQYSAQCQVTALESFSQTCLKQTQKKRKLIEKTSIYENMNYIVVSAVPQIAPKGIEL